MLVRKTRDAAMVSRRNSGENSAVQRTRCRDAARNRGESGNAKYMAAAAIAGSSGQGAQRPDTKEKTSRPRGGHEPRRQNGSRDAAGRPASPTSSSTRQAPPDRTILCAQRPRRRHGGASSAISQKARARK